MKKAIVIDLETTGVTENDEVLQISIIDEDGKILLNQYCRPENKTEWPMAEKINGISFEMVKDKPTLKELLSVVENIINSSSLIIGYNVDFDLGFLKRIQTNIQWSNIITFDVMKAFAEIYKEPKRYGRGYKYQKLSKCASYYKYKFKAHDSLEDCKATLHCYKKITE